MVHLLRPNRLSAGVVAATLALTLAGPMIGARPALAQNGGDQTYSADPQHGFARYGDLKYGPDFEHFDYANPDAPKTGTIVRGSFGGYDTFNQFVPQGDAASGLEYLYTSLMVSSADERFSMYGLVAESVELAEDASWVVFNIREEARWHDGEPITAEDVVFSYNKRLNEGSPGFRNIMQRVDDVRALGERRVVFVLGDDGDRELAQTVAGLTLIPEHYWADRSFESTLEPPLGSGPYRIARFEPGRFVEYERVRDWWAEDLPVAAGQNNFNTIRYDSYRDRDVMFQAFKAGEIDFWQENKAQRWAEGYDFPDVNRGRIQKEKIEHDIVQPMQGLAFNTRREIFADRDVRWALTLMFDFEWLNRNIFYGQYTRHESFFSNSDLAHQGPPNEAQREILEPYRDALPEEVYNSAYDAPETDGSGRLRDKQRQALRILQDNGWTLEDGTLTNNETGEPFEFTILIYQQSTERVVLPFARNLERLGITANVQQIDTNTWLNRLWSFDFDMTTMVFPRTQAPGNEQRNFWSCQAAETQSSWNVMGICNEGIDGLIEDLVDAGDWESVKEHTRALDRALMWGHYVIPQYYLPAWRLAYWDRFGRPETLPRYSFGFPDIWWLDRQASAALNLDR